jgi:hypothetical protein
MTLTSQIHLNIAVAEINNGPKWMFLPNFPPDFKSLAPHPVGFVFWMVRELNRVDTHPA